MSGRRHVLVVYFLNQYPPRASISDHLYCFARYTPHRCWYLNLADGGVPSYLADTPFDVVVFHTSFLGIRWNPPLFRSLMARAALLKAIPAVRVALPQDEFIHTALLGEFLREFEVDWVFSVAPASEWPKIYPHVDRSRTRFAEVLTGYLDPGTVERIGRLAAAAPERSLDLGYRAWRAAPWLGRHGMLKARIADVLAQEAPAAGLSCDISTRDEDTLLGDDWYQFLLRCRYTIGVEGGATILDADGSIRERTEAYLREHPDAGFDEVEAACFPGVDGTLQLLALSPRHLEACATRTCQVLVEGAYNGVLRPGEHYVELRRDFGNLAEVLEAMRRDDLRQAMAERAYRDVVASGRYAYPAFARDVLDRALAEAGEPSGPDGRRVRLAHARTVVRETIGWRRRAVRAAVQRSPVGRILRRLRARLRGAPRA